MYEDVAQLGPDTLYAAISTFPPIVSHSIYAQVPVERVQAFITEFCDPKWPEGEGDEDEEEDGKVSGMEPGAGPVPA